MNEIHALLACSTATDMARWQQRIQKAWAATDCRLALRQHELTDAPPTRLDRISKKNILLVPFKDLDRISSLSYSDEQRPPLLVLLDTAIERPVPPELSDVSVDTLRSDELWRLTPAVKRLTVQHTLNSTRQNPPRFSEFDTFSYSVSHDLRAPIRQLRQLIEILREDHVSATDQAGLDVLNDIERLQEKMRDLIEGLLTLSRLSNTPLQPETFDLKPLVEEELQALQRQEPEREVEWQIPDRVIVTADIKLMRIMLLNLIDNAWKFTRHQATPRIEVGTDRIAGDTVYYVRDNGIGFDANQAQTLFKPFQRGLAAHDFAGTGLGLAIAQRIVRRHGGRIWAEGAPGQGATLYFTLATGTNAAYG
ncbi:hypothetical protein CAI21_18445 [Alkalilimnicola ehrlichii]|uniref:histidine kinase n=1 Tax=Alkalilimnicola ehrlichii TaxID=351052 RepID=A0A3E0WL06_9GAMM|nr:ATP-binding protein [Alkalilimnicola ehrlichii]RFA25749.1 hypothetical protein CAI21_18445 [Alkalilimnicola ehrlichii]RFA32831.1 hypothetical protein CAL65_18695 [Alkalilimnicola ehrlichii]